MATLQQQQVYNNIFIHLIQVISSKIETFFYYISAILHLSFILYIFILVPEGVPTVPAELTLQDVAARAGIKNLDILDQECSQQVLLSLAKHCVDWQLIGFHLELTKADIVAVDEDYRTAEQKRVEILGKWKENFAFKATYRIFIEALLSCRKASDAIEACKVIVSSKLQ